MKNSVAVAVLLAASFAAPTLPAQAATLSDHPNCLVLPALQQECWDLARDIASEGTEATAVAIEAAADEASAMGVPLWWTCTRAAEGSGYLLDC